MENTKISTMRYLLVLVSLLLLLPTKGEAATSSIDCSSASLQAAIDKAKPGDTIFVNGTCNENLNIPEEVHRITLDGQGKATINGPDKTTSAIAVLGRGITIKGFTVRGGQRGILVFRGGTAVVEGNTIENVASQHGVQVAQGSSARIVNNTIRSNPGHGILVTSSSQAFIGFLSIADTTARRNTIQNNGGYGIVVTRTSSARINGNTITDNKRAGLLVQGTSYADIRGNTINSNGRDGIFVVSNSTVSLGSDTGSGLFQLPNTTSAPNSGFGIRCSINSSADGRLGTLNGSKGAKDFTEPGCVDSLIP
jgi:parallel beta-helix repeat protein